MKPISMWFLISVLLLGQMGCRHSFTIRNTEDQKVVFHSSDISGYREWFLQYDVENGQIYSVQQKDYEENIHQAVDVYPKTVTRYDGWIIRQYDRGHGLQNKWIARGKLSPDGQDLNVIQSNRLYFITQPYVHLKPSENLECIALSTNTKDILRARKIEGIMSKDEACFGLLPLSENKLVLKLLNISTLDPCIGVFDCETEKITHQIRLDVNVGDKRWDVCLGDYQLSISPDQTRILLYNKQGILDLYDSSLNKIFNISFVDLLGIDKSEKINDIKLDWLDNQSVVLFSRYHGYWGV